MPTDDAGEPAPLSSPDQPDQPGAPAGPDGSGDSGDPEQSDVSSASRRAGWALLRAELRHERHGVVLGVIVGLLWTSARVVMPLLVEQAIDLGITPRDSGALARWSLAVAIAAVLAATFTGVRRYFAFQVSRRMEANLREQLFAHIQKLHASFHDRSSVGDLMSRSNADLLQIQNLVVLIPLTISNSVTVLAIATLMLVKNPVLAVLALGALPLLNYLGKRFSTNLHPAAMAIQQESADLATVVEESVSGIRVVKGLGSESVQRGRLAAEADELYDASMGAARVRARYLPAMELLPSIGVVAVLAYGGNQVIDGTASLGELVAFNVYIGLLIWPLRMLGMIIAQTQRAIASAERVVEVLGTDPEVVDPEHPSDLPARGDGAAVGLVRFADVRFGYSAGSAPVLDGLDLTLEPGESVALVGATGSGKSTVARLLLRFYDVDGGSVTVDGVDVRELRVADLRRAVSIVFEDTFLFSATIADNIAFGVPDASVDDVQRAARSAGAHEFIEALPEGYETEVGERGFALSGGQRQRIAIARAILADPRVLVLDDATSAVDPTKEHEIRDALTEVMDRRTTLVIAHRPATIALADRVALVDGGRIVATGAHTDLLATSPRYREVLAAAAAHEHHDDDAVPDGAQGPTDEQATGTRESEPEAAR